MNHARHSQFGQLPLGKYPTGERRRRYRRTGRRLLAGGLRKKIPALVKVAGQFVLEPQLFLLELVELDHVGERAVLFFIDLCRESSVLRCQLLDMCLVHRCYSFLRMRLNSVGSKTLF